MSNVHVSIVRVRGVTDTGTSMQIETSDSLGTAETIVSDALGSVSTLAAASQYTGDEARFQAWRVANCGSDHVYVEFGAAPTATAAGKAVPAGSVCFFAVNAFGDKVAVINA